MKKIKLLIGVVFAAGLLSCEDDNKFISPSLEGLTMDIQVGGPQEPNQAFVNLYAGTQVSVQRTNWDLGFNSGSDFRVVINSAAESLVRKLAKNDLTQVTAEDTVGFGSQLSLDAIFNSVLVPPPPAWVSESVTWVDDPSGELSLTAIDEISATDGSNPVYIINRGKLPDGSAIGWMKFRILREAEGYLIQYAPIGSTTFETAIIPKQASLNFNYFNFENGVVQFEPLKSDWAISFTTAIEILNFGVDFPYRVKDYVITNRNDVSVAEVVISDTQTLSQAYEAFTRQDANTLTFISQVNSIGSGWRTVASPTPGSVTAVKGDRFFIIKDSAGNYFKLIFTAMLNSSGERGYPQIQFQLLQ